MQYGVNNNLSNQIYSLGQVNFKLRESLQGILEVIRILESNVWEGKSRDAALDLLTIFHTYHLKLIEASERNLSALTELDEKASSYMSSGAIPVLWESDSPSKSFEEKVYAKANETATYLYNEANQAEKYVENKAVEAGKYVEDKVSETGKYIGNKINETENYAKEKAGQVSEYAANKMEEAEKGLSDAYNNASNLLSKIL